MQFRDKNVLTIIVVVQHFERVIFQLGGLGI